MNPFTAQGKPRGMRGWHARGFVIIAIAMTLPVALQAQPPALELGEHPLVDTIWEVNLARRIDKPALQAQLQEADYILLGEKHDNIAHHRQQAWVIRHLKGAPERIGVAFEMIDSAQIDTIVSHRFANVDALLDKLEATGVGWGYRRFYAPVFAAVVDAGYAIYAANLPRKQIRAIAMHGGDPPQEITRVLDEAPLDSNQTRSLNREIRVSHCNVLQDAMIAPMARVQRIRDAVMTHSLIENRARHRHEQMVLVAGNGHVRADRGVPHYLRSEVPAADILTLAFIEVRAGADRPGDYADRWDRAQLPFDFVWFTPRAQRDDPCKALRERMHRSNSE